MSFSQEVKEELSRHIPGARHCQLAELAALVSFLCKQTTKGKETALILETERGNVYILHEAIHTKFGELKFVKIRFFDETRLNWEAAIDFVVEDRNILLNRVGKDSRYSYIQRPEWDAVEFKTSDTLIYFLHPLASEVYSRDKK